VVSLRLIAVELEDEDVFLEAVRRSRRFHRPWVYPPTTSSEFRAFVASTGTARQRLLLWAQDGNADAGLAGYFSLGEIVRGQLNSAYLGYWASTAWEGRGVMFRGMQMLLRYGFRQLRLHRVEANIQPDNLASISLVRRSGFRHEGFSPRYLKVGGRWRDHERWAMTVEDWRVAS